MDWQETFAGLAVALAGAYIFWRGLRVWRATKSGCGGGCGCAKSHPPSSSVKTAVIAPEDLVLRKRS